MNTWVLISIFLLVVISYFVIRIRSGIIKDREKLLKIRQETRNRFYGSRNEKIEYFVDTRPTRPENFGRKITWLSIKSSDHESIVSHFKKQGKKSYKTNMECGVHGSYASNIFVLPVLNNWTLVIHPNLGFSDTNDLNYLIDLSDKFGEVQFFGSHRVSSYSSWIRVVNSQILRAYGVADGETYFNIGDWSKEEVGFREASIKRADDKEELDWINGEGKLFSISDEDNVLAMAEKWSVNPGSINSILAEELGTIIES